MSLLYIVLRFKIQDFLSRCIIFISKEVRIDRGVN